MKKLTQSQVALLIGFCLASGIKVPSLVPLWSGHDTASFNAGKALVADTSLSQNGKRQ
jgi:hypothetical protein